MTRTLTSLLPLTLLSATLLAQSTPAPPHTLLVAADRRPALSLAGDWHIIVDPYNNGLGGRYFQDLAPHGNDLREYNFATSPTLHVPGDWNTQRPDLLNYEGPLWYERHVALTPQPNTRSFLHIGAANYRSRAWVNGQLVCDHEGGFTPFDCDITSAAKPGDNSVVILVDSTRIPDGVPYPQNRLGQLRRPHPRRLHPHRPHNLHRRLRPPPRPLHPLQNRRLHPRRRLFTEHPGLHRHSRSPPPHLRHHRLRRPRHPSPSPRPTWPSGPPKPPTYTTSRLPQVPTNSPTRSASAPSKPATPRSSSTANPSSSTASASTPKPPSAPAASTPTPTSPPSSAGSKTSTPTTSASPTTPMTSA